MREGGCKGGQETPRGTGRPNQTPLKSIPYITINIKVPIDLEQETRQTIHLILGV